MKPFYFLLAALAVSFCQLCGEADGQGSGFRQGAAFGFAVA